MGNYSGMGLELLSALPLRRLRSHMSTQNHCNHVMIIKHATVLSSASDCASTLGDLPRCDGDKYPSAQGSNLHNATTQKALADFLT